MNGLLSEKEVLRRLGIKDFRHLTKANVLELASMLDKMNPKVARKALDQFPKFVDTAKEMLADYKAILDKRVKENDRSVQAVYNSCNKIIALLQEELYNEKLTFSDKRYIIQKIKDVADMMGRKDTKNTMRTCSTNKELGEAIKNNADYICIEGDAKKAYLKIAAAGKVAWAVCFGALAVAVTTIIAAQVTAPFTGGLSEATMFALAGPSIGVATGTLGFAAFPAVLIAVAAGGVGALNKLRDNYRIIKKTDDCVILKLK